MNIKFNESRSVKVATLTCLLMLLVGCNGLSGSNNSGSEGVVTPVSEPTLEDEATQGALPDFTIVDITSSASTESEGTEGHIDSIRVQATITNSGDSAALVPNAWFNVSTDTEDNGNYQRTAVTMVPVGNQEPVLQPGETGLFEATNRPQGVVKIQIGRSGTHYGRLWLNPDLSERYLNPESTVMESHELEEKGYDNNRSELIAFESARRPSTGADCTLDQYEENDTDELATLITTNVVYTFNACDEAFEMMAIELTAGVTYEIKQLFNDFSGTWDLTIVNPVGEYVVRKKRDVLLTPQTSGRYLIVAESDFSSFAELLLEVTEQ